MAPAVQRAHRPMSPRRPSERALIATDQKDDASRALAPESCPIGRSCVSVPGSTVSTCQSPPTRPLLDPAPHPCRAGAVAWVAIVFELAGVLAVGALSISFPELFPHDTVWSMFGRGYLFIPLVLPVFGIWWLRTHGPIREAQPALHAEANA